VTGTPGLLDHARAAAQLLGGGYFSPEIVAPGLGERSGLRGALVLAMQAGERA
jgi:fructokinase